MMIAVRVQPDGTVRSVRELINIAISGHVPITFSGRIWSLTIQYISGGGSRVIGAPGLGANHEGFELPSGAGRVYQLKAEENNVISIDDVYITGLANAVVSILAFTA